MNHNFESNLVLMIRESEWDARFDSSYFLNQRTNHVFKDNGKITIKLSIQEFVESCELFLGESEARRSGVCKTVRGNN